MRKKTGPGHGQKVWRATGPASRKSCLASQLLDACKDGKWMNNVRKDIL